MFRIGALVGAAEAAKNMHRGGNGNRGFCRSHRRVVNTASAALGPTFRADVRGSRAVLRAGALAGALVGAAEAAKNMHRSGNGNRGFCRSYRQAVNTATTGTARGGFRDRFPCRINHGISVLWSVIVTFATLVLPSRKTEKTARINILSREVECGTGIAQ